MLEHIRLCERNLVEKNGRGETVSTDGMSFVRTQYKQHETYQRESQNLVTFSRKHRPKEFASRYPCSKRVHGSNCFKHWSMMGFIGNRARCRRALRAMLKIQRQGQASKSVSPFQSVRNDWHFLRRWLQNLALKIRQLMPFGYHAAERRFGNRLYMR